jgi:hypothetical protein
MFITSPWPKEVIVLGVRAHPEPHDDVVFDDAECAMPESAVIRGERRR